MSEFYEAAPDETPVTMDYPCMDVNTGRQMIQTRTEYYGSKLTVEEIRSRLLGLGYIDRSDDGDNYTYSLDHKTGKPLYPHRHEFVIAETDRWGHSSYKEPDSRVTVQIHLYFYDWDMYEYECPAYDTFGECDMASDDCGYDHNIGWDYDEYAKALELIDNDYYAPPKPREQYVPQSAKYKQVIGSLPFGALSMFNGGKC